MWAEQRPRGPKPSAPAGPYLTSCPDSVADKSLVSFSACHLNPETSWIPDHMHPRGGAVHLLHAIIWAEPSVEDLYEVAYQVPSILPGLPVRLIWYFLCSITARMEGKPPLSPAKCICVEEGTNSRGDGQDSDSQM